MKHILRKKTVIIGIFILIVSLLFSVGVSAQENIKENKPLSISVTVQERNGVAVNDYFFRRGIALEKGQVYSVEDVCLTENGTQIVSTAEALQKYDDGSVCWLLVSGVVDLKPNECKQLTVTYGNTEATSVSYTQDSTRTTVTSPNISMVFGPKGIESLKYRNSEMLNSEGINLYVKTGGKTDYLTVTEISVLKSTKTYSKFKLKGRLREDILGEMYVTLAEGAERIQIDSRITVQDNFMIESTGLTVGAEYSGAEAGDVIDSDFLDLGTMQLSTYDNTRFNGATNIAGATGYVIGDDSLDFAPLVNGKAYQYYDGFSRTTHLYVGFSGDAEPFAKTLALPPAIKIDNEQYVRAGQILTTQMSALSKKCMESFKFGYSKSIGIFNAGILPYEINLDEGIVGRFGTMPGEIEYNFGVCWMMTGDEEMYRHLFDLAEVRADLCAYRGGFPNIYGVLRGATTTDTYRFNMAHSYYGDQGGLYMAYVLSGDEWVFETFKMSMEKTLYDMYKDTSLDGSRAILYHTWPLDTASLPGLSPDYCESRGLIRVRTFYLAAQLLEDDRYLRAMEDFLKWAKAAQRPDGSYPHFMYDAGGKYYDSVTHEEVVKDYIMLYGVRGISQLLDFTENETAFEIITKVADYLCSQCENFGEVLWYPNSDKEVYNLNDGGGRGPSPFTTALAMDVMCTAFEKTGNERYLITLARFLDAFLGMEIGGLGAEDYGAKEIAPKGDRLKVGESPRGSSLLRCSDNLSKIFTKNKERLLELGFENVLLIFEQDAEAEEKAEVLNYVFPDVIHNVYRAGNEKAVFVRNMCAEGNDPNGDWEKTVQIVFDENSLWQGVKNVVKDNKSVMLEKYLKQAEGYSAISRPIFIEQFSGSADINVIKYNSEEIEVDFDGTFDAGIKIKNGKFEINDNESYNINLSYNCGVTKLRITKGGKIKSINGELTVMFNNKGEEIPFVGATEIAMAGLGDFDPQAPLSDLQLEALMKKLFNSDIDLNAPQPTWEEFGKIIVPALGADAGYVLENAGLETAFDARADADISDEAAVLYGAEALDVVYNGNKLSSDVYLAKESIYGTKVSWKCNREDIMSSDGVLNRTNADCDSITLTATVTKNGASATREFLIPLLPMSIPTAAQGPGFADETAFPLIPQTKEFEITYTAIPFLPNIDSTMCFTSSKIGTRTNADIPYIVRFNPSGVIDMYNSNTYTKGALAYEVNKKYYFRIVIRPEEMTYDAYVTPEGGKEVTIGENCGARQSAPVVDMIDKFWTWAGEANCYKVSDVSLMLKDDKKTESTGNGYYDENGLVFGRYRFSQTSIFPTFSDDGLILNWVNAGSYRPQIGGQMTFYIGKAENRTENLSLIQILKSVSLLDNGIKESSFVTPASLSRILVAIEQKK